jgi:hypothetical protein
LLGGLAELLVGPPLYTVHLGRLVRRVVYPVSPVCEAISDLGMVADRHMEGQLGCIKHSSSILEKIKSWYLFLENPEKIFKHI